jgi:putative flippase GtrA
MTRWSYIFLGGDAAQPHVRRMAWRVGLASFALGLGFGHFDIGITPTSKSVAIGVAAATALFTAFLANEYRHFYQHSDEMIRRTLVASLAVAGLAVMGAAGIYGVAEMLFGLPPVPMLYVFLFATVVSSAAWMTVAWKTS